MSDRHHILEEQLRQLRAAPLDEALLDRLVNAAEGSWEITTTSEASFESSLRAHSPAALPPAFLDQLVATTRNVHFPVNEKILLFPRGKASPDSRRSWPVWRSVAAVAIIGAASAFLMPTPAPRQTAAAAIPSPSAISSPSANLTPTAPSGNFVPASFNRGVSELHDEGVVWKNQQSPQRVVRVVLHDRVTFQDENGRTLEMEHPRVQYMLVPDKTD